MSIASTLTKEIDRELPDARSKLASYADLYADALKGRRMCMCGILAAECLSLPEPMRRAVIDLLDKNQRWLAGVLCQGTKDRTLTFAGTPEEVTQSILSTLGARC